MTYRQRQSSHPKQTPPRQQQRQAKPKPIPKLPQPPSGGLFTAKLVIAVFFIFVFVYIGHSIRVFMTPGVNTMIVRMSTIEEPRSVQGVIFRDEVVFFADMAGHVDFLVQENDRVSRDTRVASIRSDRASAAERYIANVEDQARDLQTLRPATYETDAGVQRLNDNMVNMVNGRIHSFATLSLSEIYALRDDLYRVINARNQINIASGLAWDPLAREHERHTSALGVYSRNVYASASGIMSRLIDGHEAAFNLGEITRDDILALADCEPITPVQEVQEGDAVFKLVGNVWYIAAYMPNDMIQNFTEGARHTVYLNNAITGRYEPHSLRIERIDYGVRYSLVVFRNTRHVIEFLNQRSITIRTTSGIRRGLAIPDTAIVSRRHYRIPIDFIHGDTEKYVLITTEAGNTIIPVNVYEETEYHMYVHATPGLIIGSILVPRDSDDGSHIHLTHLTEAHVRVQYGVYADIFGTVEFRPIILGENGIEAGYNLLDPSLNHGISEFQNIVTDASTVTAGDLIR